MPQIAERTISLASLLRESAASSSAEADLAGIRGQAKQLRQEVAGLSRYSRALLKSEAEISQLSDLLAAWQPLSSRLENWSGQLQKRATSHDESRAALAKAELEWELTERSAELSELPAEVRKRVEANLLAIREAQRSVTARRNATSLLQAELVDLRVEIDTILAEIRAAESKQRKGLFEVDSAPIWQRPLAKASPAPIRPAAAASEQIPSWLREALLRVLRQIGLFFGISILCWLILRSLQGKAGDWHGSTDEHVRAFAFAVKRPVSSALLLSAMVTALTMRDSSNWMIGMAGVVLLAPSLRLLPGLIGDDLRRFFYLLIALLIARSTVGMIPDSSGWYRPGLLVYQALLCGSLFLLWMAVRRRGTPGRWAAAMRVLSGVGLSASLLALPANIMGMLQLSKLLANAVLFSLYGAVVLRGVVMILSGLLIAFVRSRRLDFITSSGETQGLIESRILRGVSLFGLLAFIALVLKVTNLLDPFLLYTSDLLNNEFRFGAITVTIYSVALFLLIIGGSIAASKGLRFGLEVGVYPRIGVQIGQANALSKLLHYGVLLAGFLLAIAAAGVELSNIAILAGGLSVGIGLGLQSVVNNFVSGLILLFERPIRVGDGVSVGSTSGIVKDIGIRASIIRSWEGAEIVVPNGDLISGTLTNWTHSDTHRRVDINVGAAYGSDSKKVIEILVSIAAKQDLVMQDPEPIALFIGFGDNSLNFVLRFWCDTANWVTVSSEVHTRIDEAFREAGIEIPFPQRDVNIRSLPALRIDGSAATMGDKAQ